MLEAHRSCASAGRPCPATPGEATGWPMAWSRPRRQRREFSALHLGGASRDRWAHHDSASRSRLLDWLGPCSRSALWASLPSPCETLTICTRRFSAASGSLAFFRCLAPNLGDQPFSADAKLRNQIEAHRLRPLLGQIDVVIRASLAVAVPSDEKGIAREPAIAQGAPERHQC